MASMALGPAAAGAEERFHSGSTELTVGGAYSLSHATVDGGDAESVDGFQFLPHFGYFHRRARTRVAAGNFELLAEPTLVH
jgi:hypothetical protein